MALFCFSFLSFFSKESSEKIKLGWENEGGVGHFTTWSNLQNKTNELPPRHVACPSWPRSDVHTTVQHLFDAHVSFWCHFSDKLSCFAFLVWPSNLGVPSTGFCLFQKQDFLRTQSRSFVEGRSFGIFLSLLWNILGVLAAFPSNCPSLPEASGYHQFSLMLCSLVRRIYLFIYFWSAHRLGCAVGPIHLRCVCDGPQKEVHALC